MSGGSYDYAYQKLNDFADALSGRLKGQCSCASPLLREAFVAHCFSVAQAMKAIEWNDSCDGDEKEEQLIRAVLSFGEGVQAGVERVRQIRDELEVALKEIREMCGK